MSCCPGSVPRRDRPGSARVLVTELSGPGHINPAPTRRPCEDLDTEVELHLSAEGLKSLCGAEDLSVVTSMEICVDTRETTLAYFGSLLPKLVQLKMNNSLVTSVRDLGSSLSRLQVLWMSRCCLRDLDGISALFRLQELYVAYNGLSHLSELAMLEHLQLLDLEGNDVDDLVQVQYLGLCSKLQRLTLEGNPVCVRPAPTATQASDYRYRAAVKELVPQLRYLDNVRAEDEEPSRSRIAAEDWAVLRSAIRDRRSSQSAAEDGVCTGGGPFTSVFVEAAAERSRPGSAKRPASSRSCVWPPSSPGSRLLSPPGSRPGSADAGVAAVEAETSVLTHGAGQIVYCGNPVQAVRARRQKLKTAPTKSTFTPRDLLLHVPEHTYDLEEPDGRGRGDVLAELRAWRQQHGRRLQAIEMDRAPQVLAIQHSDEDEGNYDDEEEGFGGMRSDRSAESQDDSSFQSLSPDLHHGEAPPPDVAQLSLSSDTSLSPSSPVGATLAPAERKPQGFRARRLHLSRAESEHFHQAGLPQVTHRLHPPATRALDGGVDVSGTQRDNEPHHGPQTSRLPLRPPIARRCRLVPAASRPAGGAHTQTDSRGAECQL